MSFKVEITGKLLFDGPGIKEFGDAPWPVTAFVGIPLGVKEQSGEQRHVTALIGVYNPRHAGLLNRAKRDTWIKLRGELAARCSIDAKGRRFDGPTVIADSLEIYPW